MCAHVSGAEAVQLQECALTLSQIIEMEILAVLHLLLTITDEQHHN